MNHTRKLFRTLSILLCLLIAFTVASDYQSSKQQDLDSSKNIRTILSNTDLDEIGSIGDVPSIEGLRPIVLYKNGIIKISQNEDTLITTSEISKILVSEITDYRNLQWFLDKDKDIAIGYKRKSHPSYITNIISISVLALLAAFLRRQLGQSIRRIKKIKSETSFKIKELEELTTEQSTKLSLINSGDLSPINEDLRKKLETALTKDIDSSTVCSLIKEGKISEIECDQLSQTIEEYKNLHVGQAYERFERMMGMPIRREDDFENVYLELQLEHTASIEKVNLLSSEVSDLKTELDTAICENKKLREKVGLVEDSLASASKAVKESLSILEERKEKNSSATAISKDCQTHTEKAIKVVSEASNSMEEIKQFSIKIAAIVTLIDEIAFKTKLLALNANVEAANAGEHGKGFEVVANEVNELAQNSAERSDEIKKLIDETLLSINSGVRNVQDTKSSLNDLADNIKGIDEAIRELSALSEEQKHCLSTIEIKDDSRKTLLRMKETKEQLSPATNDAPPFTKNKVNTTTTQPAIEPDSGITTTPAHHKNKGDYSKVDEDSHWETF